MGKEKSSDLKIYKKNNNILNTSGNIEYLNFTDYELNFLKYQHALLFDKRTYLKYYISLIKTKHPLIFSLFSFSEYNLKIVKISILLLSFTIYFAINTLFFTNSSIHEIYQNNGNFYLKNQIAKIIYSFIISHIICSLIKFFSLSERDILTIKYEIKIEKAKNRARKVKRCLFIKYICFFVLGLVFLIFFWYYLSSFCAVYQNSQKYPFINTIISVTIALIYPFLINLIPGFLRIPSLKNKKKWECLYIISKIIQLL